MDTETAQPVRTESFESLAARLQDRLDIKGPDDCWEFRPPVNPAGYGRLRFRGRVHFVHRLAVMLDGRDVEGAYVCHHCDNPPCCNPSHLYVGDAASNNRDAMERGNRPKGEGHYNSRLTDEQVRQIRDRYTRNFEKIKRGWRSNARELAAEYGISESHVRNLVCGNYRVDA